MMPASLALVRITFIDARERNVAIAVWMSTAIAGAAAGPIMGGLLFEFFWWGSVFLINVPFVIVTVFAIIAVSPSNMANPAKQWDLTSSIWAMFTMLGGVMAIKELANSHRNMWVFSTAVVIGIIGLLLFIFRQRKLDEPLLDTAIFRNRMFTGGTITAGLLMFNVVGVELMTTQEFQTTDGFNDLRLERR